jgi:hypothetical protein
LIEFRRRAFLRVPGPGVVAATLGSIGEGAEIQDQIARARPMTAREERSAHTQLDC